MTILVFVVKIRYKSLMVNCGAVLRELVNWGSDDSR
jgi:hypothetical protein